MKVSVLCSSIEHPVYDYLVKWGKFAELKTKLSELSGGDILFLVSCTEIVKAEDRAKYKNVFVIHAADLPKGRGWSPHIWQILEGKSEIVITLLEAQDKVDSGDIWAQEKIHFEGHELYDEINYKIFEAEIKLMDFVLENYASIKPKVQIGEPSYYRKRTPDDSRVDPNQSIAAQFNLLRVADSNRYPAYFELMGCKYKIILEKI